MSCIIKVWILWRQSNDKHNYPFNMLKGKWSCSIEVYWSIYNLNYKLVRKFLEPLTWIYFSSLFQAETILKNHTDFKNFIMTLSNSTENNLKKWLLQVIIVWQTERSRYDNRANGQGWFCLDIKIIHKQYNVITTVIIYITLC